MVFDVVVVVVLPLFRSGGPRCFGSSKSVGGGGLWATSVTLLVPGDSSIIDSCPSGYVISSLRRELVDRDNDE